jgi:hypothetical protein
VELPPPRVTRPALETEIVKAQPQELRPRRGQDLVAERPLAETESQAVGVQAAARAESLFPEEFLAATARQTAARFR